MLGGQLGQCSPAARTLWGQPCLLREVVPPAWVLNMDPKKGELKSDGDRGKGGGWEGNMGV